MSSGLVSNVLIRVVMISNTAGLLSGLLLLVLLLWHYSPGWALASFKSFRHSSWLWAVLFQFLHPGLASSSVTWSSHLNSGLPFGLLPPGWDVKYLSSWIIIIQTHNMSCPPQLADFYKFYHFFFFFFFFLLLLEKLIEFPVGPTAPVTSLRQQM